MDVRLPDGTVVTNVPEGITQSELMARVGKSREQPTAEIPPTDPPRFAAKVPEKNIIDEWILSTFGDKLAKFPDIQGSIPGRLIQGAADLPVGLMQLGMNAYGQGDKINPKIQAINAKTENLRGPDAGFDWARLIGNLLNPVPYKAAGAITPAASVPGRMMQGAGMGAGISAATPVTKGDDFASDKAKQTVIGALIGGAIPAVTSAAGGAYNVARNVIDPWLPGGIDRAAGRTLNNATGDKRDAVVQALEQAKKIVPGSNPTAAEVAAPAGSAEFSGLQKVAQAQRPSEYAGIDRVNESARKAAIGGIAKTEKELSAAVKNRAENASQAYGSIEKNLVSGKSDSELMEEAIKNRFLSKASALQDQGRFQTFGAQQESLANKWTPVTGMPRVSGRYAPQAENVKPAAAAAQETGWIAKYRQNEKEFLENTHELLKNTVGMSDVSLTKFLGRPSMREAIKDAAESAAEKGSYFPSGKGDKFTIENLQRIKESMDSGILAARNAADSGKRPVLSPSELTSTRDSFVKWLSNKSPEWRDARLQYASDSIPMNRMQVGQELEKKLTSSLGTTERPTVFANAVENAPQTIKKATGNPRYDKLEQVLTEKEVNAVRSVVDDLARTGEHDRLAQFGTPKARELVGQITPSVPAAGMFSPHYSVMRAIINRFSGKVEGKSLDRLAQGMETPEGALRLMRAAGIPKSKQDAVIEAMMKQAAKNTAPMMAAEQY